MIRFAKHDSWAKQDLLLIARHQGFWFSHFTVGASKDLEILIDTGSSDAILNPGIYQPSSASQDQNRRFHISYATTNPDGSGSLSVSASSSSDTNNTLLVCSVS